MEGKQAIINKILEDANYSANEITLNAEKEVSSLLDSARKLADDYTNTQKIALQKETEEIVKRRLTVAELDVRKLTLKAKQDLIGEVFSLVLTKLCNLEKKSYLSFVESLLIKNADEGDAIVLSKDGVLSKEDFVSLDIYKQKNLSVKSEIGDFKGGIMLIGESSDKDLTFSSLVNNLTEEKTSEVAQLLF